MDRYWDDYNPDLLPLIPPDAKVILEVGCGTGRLCEAYRRINPGVKWYGVESNWEAARAAMDRGVFARCVDIETDSIGNWLDVQDADVLIFGDVLEHLRDPWTVLKRLTEYVRPGGQILASIPNVQHYSVILSLLHGQWTYGQEGLLDWTHLRFFTLRSIREMFQQAGLDIFEVRGRRLHDPDGLAQWEDFLRHVTIPDLATQGVVYQYLVRSIRPVLKAKPSVHVHELAVNLHCEITEMHKAPISKLHIHAIGDGTICERPRLHEPAAMLSTIPGVRCDTDRHAPVMPGQILIQQRFRGLDIDCQRRLIEAGSLIIAEIDDDPEWLVGLPESDFLPLRAVHAIQTTTEVMAETCRRFNPHVAVFPNQIASLPPPREYEPRDCVRIFFGALNREKDWAPIMSALNRVIQDHDVLFEVIHDREFFQSLETSSKRFTPFCQWPEYRAILRSCDIALLPLEDNRVNRHKSDLKFLECAAEGVAALASKVVYEETIKIAKGWPGVLYDDANSFEAGLDTLIGNAKIRQTIAQVGYTYVRDHRLLSQHYRRRHEWYLSLMDQKSALTRDLLERVPELRSAPALAGSRPAPVASPA